MTKLEIVVPGRPVPWARAGNKAGRFYTPKKRRNHRKYVAEVLANESRGVTGYQQNVLIGPLLLQALFVFSKTEPLTWFRLVELETLGNLEPTMLPIKSDVEYHTGRPDCDNLVKQIMEAIEDSGVLSGEDGQISMIHAAKVKRK